jgi:hypothetical protein
VNISLQEAVSVLRKWKSDHRLIQCYFRDSPNERTESSLSVVGRVEEINELYVRIDCRTFPAIVRGDLYGCALNLDNALDFMLTDHRSMNADDPSKKAMEESIEMILGVALRSGCFCEFRAAKMTDELFNGGE